MSEVTHVLIRCFEAHHTSKLPDVRLHVCTYERNLISILKLKAVGVDIELVPVAK